MVTGFICSCTVYIFLTRLLDLYIAVIFIFFFFQAEDGIRDLTVTGVQTCALPISPNFFTTYFFIKSQPSCAKYSSKLILHGLGFAASFLVFPKTDLYMQLKKERSEERRVGKECRSRWSPYH